jgi:hypothetical protein
MKPPVSKLRQILASMSPKLHSHAVVYCSVPYDQDVSALAPIVTVREEEGLTLVLPEAQARTAQLVVMYRAAWITLTVHSDLHAVGLTAAVATELAADGISCNVVAGAFHDHLFVAWEDGERALVALKRLQSRS